jgi:serine/threonine protein kinase/tetratricopeptide (TPR) repeat protein
VSDESIFAAALAIPSPSERVAYLDRACAGQPDLRREVEELLAAHAADNPLDRPPGDLGLTGPHQPAVERPGVSVGPYKLLQEIGEGGMGTVFMAEQTEPVRRKVALKIIKPGMDSKEVVARFEAERQALSLMDHPNIARVLDAGTTDSGRPYFVMELVHGVPITEFCDTRKLSPRQRLELFVPVCQAIQHAHQKGVIHRDIKPGNILVTMYDDRPVPKVIDFGIAKAVEQRLTERTLFTQFGAFIGTFEYMSPEQAEMNAFGVDTRSDVYALGVLLYELLTGTTPLEQQRLRGAALGEVVRLIKEEEPQPPSLRLSTSGMLARVAASRRTEPAKLSALVRGELDWIVMRCLEKDRTRRYDTASALARDVERYLHDEPVEACPPTVGYRLRKAYQKNRAAVHTAAALLLAALLVVAAQTWSLLQARAARRDAEAARDVADEQRLEAERQRADAVREKERAAREKLEAERQRADAVHHKGRADKEKSVAEAILAFLLDDLLSQADAWTPVESGSGLQKRDPDLKVRTLLDRAAAKVGDTFQNQPVVEAAVRRTIGNAYRGLGEHARAIPHLEKAADLYRRHRDRGDGALLATLNDLGWGYRSAKRPAEAVGVYAEARASAEKTLGPEHLVTRLLVHHLALAYREAGRPAAAIPMLEKYRDHAAQEILNSCIRIDLAEVYLDCGRPGDAATVLQSLRKERGAAFARTDLLIRALDASGQHERAAEIRAEEVAARLKGRGLFAMDWRFADELDDLGLAWLRAGKPAKAEQAFRSCLALRKHIAPNDWPMFETQSRLGASLVRQQQFAAAEPLLRDAYAGLKRRSAYIPADKQAYLPEAAGRLVELYEKWGKPAEAATWRQTLEGLKP